MNRERRWLATLFVALVGLFGLTAHGYVENTDAEVTLHAARAWWKRGDPVLTGRGPHATPAEQALVATYFPRGQLGMPSADGDGFYVWFPIGHQALLVPCVAAGELFAQWFPEPERRLLERDGPIFGGLFWARFFASFLPVLSAAAGCVALWVLARRLGASPSDALLAVLAAALCTQFWPGTRETMSDMPGALGVFGCAAAVATYARHPARAALFVAGMFGGFAVLVRYPHALPVAALSVWAAVVAWRSGRRQDLVALVAGGAPWFAALLAANVLRFGSLTETGYSAGATGAWFSYPPWLGVPLVLVAPGKGVLWFSLPIVLALFALRAREVRRSGVVRVALFVFVATVIGIGHTAGWAAGQCWGVRYLTPAVALLVVSVFALRPPWRRGDGVRRIAIVVLGLGWLVSAGGLLAPYRGQQQLADVAARARYPEVAAHDIHDVVNFVPRFSPIHTHWIYAGLATSGRLDEGGSENTTEPLFGVVAPDAEARLARREDGGLRHVWWRAVDDLVGGAWGGGVALLWMVGTVLVWIRLARRIPTLACAGEHVPSPSSPNIADHHGRP